MTGSHDPQSEEDLDPTGIRAMLANLPDPGPMPEELVARISQSLELEQQRRSTGDTHAAYPFGPGAEEPTFGQVAGSTTPGTHTAPDQHAGDHAGQENSGRADSDVVLLDLERHRRRPGRTLLWLGGAAAVALVATVSINQLLGDTETGPGVSAQVPSSSDAAGSGSDSEAQDEAPAADAGPPEEAQQESDAGAGPLSDDTAGAEDGAAPESPAGELEKGPGGVSLPPQVQTISGTVALSETGWAEQVHTWVDTTEDAGPAGQSPWTPDRATDCVESAALDTGDAATLLLSEATWDDRGAVLVVAEISTGDVAWVLSPDCSAVLAGPAPVH